MILLISISIALYIALRLDAIYHSRLGIQIISASHNLKVLHATKSVFMPIGHTGYGDAYLYAILGFILAFVGCVIRSDTLLATIGLCVVSACVSFGLVTIYDRLEACILYTVRLIALICLLIKRARRDLPGDIYDDAFCRQETRWNEAEEQWDALLTFIDSHEDDKQEHMPLKKELCNAEKPLLDVNRARLLQLNYKVSAHHCEACEYLCLAKLKSYEPRPIL